MPIKLEDLTCEKCIYSSKVPDATRRECRRMASFTNELVNDNYWCGEGEWPVVVKGEHWITHLKLAKRRDLYCTPDLTYEWPEDHREA